MENLIQDLRYAIRTLLKHPGFTAIAVLALALGIGANTAIFSVINALLVRSLPYKEPDRLVWMWGAIRGQTSQAAVSPLDFLDYREQNQAFEQFAAAIVVPINSSLSENGDPERIVGASITTNYFQTLGIRPEFGRDFSPAEEQPGRGQVVVISHSLFARRFGGDQSIINRNITLDGKSVTVIGVMPPNFKFPNNAELWLPLSFDAFPEMKVRRAHFLRPIGRLRPGVSLAQAQAEMDTIAQQLEEKYPESNTNWALRLVPLQDQIVGNIKPTLFVLFGAVAFVLLIACANVANLLLARAAARQREVAIRSALGANRWRIVRQMLTESLLLSVLGGVFGVLLAMWGVELLVAFGGSQIPRATEIRVDLSVLVFTFGISILTGLIFGIAPALQVAKTDLNETLKEGGRSGEGAQHNRTRSLLVVAESALAVVLLIGAGLLIKSFIKLQNVTPGFEAENVLTMRLDLPRGKDTKPEQWGNFFAQLQQRLGVLPGVEFVGMVSELPLSGQPNDAPFTVEGHPVADPSQQPNADYRRINQDYFQAMHIPLLRGRYFTAQEARQSGNTAIISNSLAQLYFPDEDPIGKHIIFNFQEKNEYEVVGIVGDVTHRGLDLGTYPAIYLPSLTLPWTNLVIRTTGDPAKLAAAVRAEVKAINPGQPVSDVKTMQQWLYDSAAAPRFRTLLLGIFAFVALLLSVVGIYGVMSYVATQRTREIGIRMALGAQKSQVLRMVIQQGLRLVVSGIAVGLSAAFALTRLMNNLLYNVSAIDATTFILVAALLAGVALVACFLPARRAAKTDPVVALRYE